MQTKHIFVMVFFVLSFIFATVFILPAAAGELELNPLRGTFFLSDQDLGENADNAVAVGDLDGDTDLDVIFMNRVWLNDGRGNFTEKGQEPGFGSFKFEIALADIDNDDDLDLVTAMPGPNEIWLNDGDAGFSNSGQGLGSSGSWALAVGDVDDDDDVDVVFTNDGSPHELYLNNGSGVFTAGNQDLGNAGYRAVALEDVDGNQTLDAFFADCSLYTNDGNGVFTFKENSSCSPPDPVTLVMGDIDGDMDTDAIIGNATLNPNMVMVNDGDGNFSNSGQMLGVNSTEQVALADVDLDGDLDLFSGNTTELGGEPADQIWMNDGQGVFTDSGQTLGNTNSSGAVFGDIDGDGDPDLLVGTNLGANKLYVNGRNGVYLAIVLKD